MQSLWVLSELLLLFLLSVTGIIAIGSTEASDNVVLSVRPPPHNGDQRGGNEPHSLHNLTLRPNQTNFNMWQKLHKTLISIYLFNYTNVAEFVSGQDNKLNVQERGPYVYEETVERVNVSVKGGHITYQERRDYKFMPELSKGMKQNDTIIVPNVPLFAVVASFKDASYFLRYGIIALIKSLDAEPFLSLPADSVIRGYENAFSKMFIPVQNKQQMMEGFGLLNNNIDTRDDVTINNGYHDVYNVGGFEKVNGKSTFYYWFTAQCNNFSSATDGTIFSPYLVQNKRPLHVYMKEMCRPLTYDFEKDVTILDGRISAYRYTLSDKIPSNQNFCDLYSDYPSQGIFNASACFSGGPLFTSYPHLHKADPALIRKAVTGLNRTREYQSYIDVHPTLGYAMSGKNSVQVNVKVVKVDGFNTTEMFDDGAILPVAWLEYSLEDNTLPEDIQEDN